MAIRTFLSSEVLDPRSTLEFKKVIWHGGLVYLLIQAFMIFVILVISIFLHENFFFSIIINVVMTRRLALE
jgi:membrane protein insertase Oxa1/YidC/SpoIIIJ